LLLELLLLLLLLHLLLFAVAAEGAAFLLWLPLCLYPKVYR
jgi:hypothetical protein